MRDANHEQDAANVVQLPWDGRKLNEALSEVNREFNVRLRCFPKWVKEGRLDAVEAQDRLDRLDAARHFLSVLVAADASGSRVTSSGDMTATG